MKIYTRSGDDGTTGLLGSRRVPKDDLRIEAYGTIDELNAVLGIVRAAKVDPATDALLAQLQEELFFVGSALADPDPAGKFHAAINVDHANRLEQHIDQLESELSPLTNFILPGGTLAAAQLHLARTICRRAERLIVKLGRKPGEHVPGPLLIYLNRLSDALFVLARVVNARAGIKDITWGGK
ncbi:MAG: cob(I)yrinic acid a,c-diamide adenosyltransferase [Isosphaeraceae bacterium]